MKINEVVRQTGLNKRTIYYYIEEGLVFPETNPSNGYYIFSDSDMMKLKMLQTLRKMNFSIKEIHSVFTYPQSFHVSIQKQIIRLKREQALIAEKISSLEALDKKLPAAISYEDLTKALAHVKFPTEFNLPCVQDFADDVKLVLLYLWGNFLQGVPMTEYRQFLWGKILTSMTRSDNPNIKLIKQYIYNLSAAQISTEFENSNRHIDLVIGFTEKTIDHYVRSSLAEIEACIKNEVFVSRWKENYYRAILPAITLFDSEMNILVQELSPRFDAYYKNIHLYCRRVYDYLSSDEGLRVKTKIQNTLYDCIDMEGNHYGELAVLFSLSLAMQNALI